MTGKRDRESETFPRKHPGFQLKAHCYTYAPEPEGHYSPSLGLFLLLMEPVYQPWALFLSPSSALCFAAGRVGWSDRKAADRALPLESPGSLARLPGDGPSLPGPVASEGTVLGLGAWSQ